MPAAQNEVRKANNAALPNSQAQALRLCVAALAHSAARQDRRLTIAAVASVAAGKLVKSSSSSKGRHNLGALGGD